MRESRGVVINNASGAATSVRRNLHLYAASKAALVHLTRVWLWSSRRRYGSTRSPRASSRSLMDGAIAPTPTRRPKKLARR